MSEQVTSSGDEWFTWVVFLTLRSSVLTFVNGFVCEKHFEFRSVIQQVESM